jgi:predicted permease
MRLQLRTLARSPASSLAAVLALGLGLGLTATMFAVVDGIFLRGLPLPGGDRLVQVDAHHRAEGVERRPPAIEDVEVWRREARTVEGLAAWGGIGMGLSGGEAPPRRRNGAYVTSDLFDVVGVAPALGRPLLPADALDGAEAVVVISHRVWQSRFGGAPGVVGDEVRLAGRPARVVGVMPEGFHFPLSQDFWLPLDLASPIASRLGLQVVARRAPRVAPAAVEEELATLSGYGRQPEAAPGDGGPGVAVRPYVAGYTDPALRRNLWGLLLAVLAVLAVAAVNVAGLLLARGTERAGELAVRQALGASRRRLAAQLLGEAALLAAAGGLLGAALAWAGTTLLDRLIAAQLRSFWIDVRFDPRLLLCLVAATGLACLGAGLLPALRLAAGDPRQVLAGGGRGTTRHSRLLRTLVVVEIALCCALLTASGLTLESLTQLDGVDQGMATEGVVAAGLSLPRATWNDPESQRQMADELLQRVAALPGVRRAALATQLPIERTATGVEIEIEGVPAAPSAAALRRAQVSPDFFATLGVPVLAGRGVEASDRPGTPPVVVVERSFAEHAFPGGDAVGRRLRFLDQRSEPAWWTIVGVVPDLGSDLLPEQPRGFLPVVQRAQGAQTAPAAYVPLAQWPSSWATLLVDAAGDPLAVAPALRREVAALDPDTPLIGLTTLEGEIASLTWDYRLFGRVLSVFAATALLLAALGLFGVMSLTVERRRREIGVRMALGARRQGVLRWVLASALRQVAAGLALGLALGIGLARALQGLLYGVEPWDPRVLLTVAAVLTATALAASWLPARRAARLDPAEALRAE